jgi:hypothetical protein
MYGWRTQLEFCCYLLHLLEPAQSYRIVYTIHLVLKISVSKRFNDWYKIHQTAFGPKKSCIGKLHSCDDHKICGKLPVINWFIRFHVPLKTFSLIWRHHHCRWRAAKFRPMFDAQGLWAGRDLYRATPNVTRNLRYPGLIRRTAPFLRLIRHTWGCEGPILTRILNETVKNPVTSTFLSAGYLELKLMHI